jgi:hypothetical protein
MADGRKVPGTASRPRAGSGGLRGMALELLGAPGFSRGPRAHIGGLRASRSTRGGPHG